MVCDHFHSVVDFAVSGCGKSWSETTVEGVTFQYLGCWKVDCLTAELARITAIVKGMETKMTKETERKTNGERTKESMTYRKVTGEKVTVEKEEGIRGQEMRNVEATGGKVEGRKEVRVDVTKRKSITTMMTGRKETAKKEQQRKRHREKSATREIQNGGAILKQWSRGIENNVYLRETPFCEEQTGH